MAAPAGGGGSAVSVLAPNGRRHTVKVTPSTVLLQVRPPAPGRAGVAAPPGPAVAPERRGGARGGACGGQWASPARRPALLEVRSAGSGVPEWGVAPRRRVVASRVSSRARRPRPSLEPSLPGRRAGGRPRPTSSSRTLDGPAFVPGSDLLSHALHFCRALRVTSNEFNMKCSLSPCCRG